MLKCFGFIISPVRGVGVHPPSPAFSNPFCISRRENVYVYNPYDGFNQSSKSVHLRKVIVLQCEVSGRRKVHFIVRNYTLLTGRVNN